MLTLDLSLAIAEVDGMLARMLNMGPAMAEIGHMASSVVQDNILHGKRSPEGAPWAPWLSATRIERTKKGNAAQGLLWDTGRLVNSIHATVGHNEVSIGTDVAYAADLHFGVPGHMEARPFMGWGAEDIKHASAAVSRYISTGLPA